MKRFLFLLVISGLLFSCDKKEERLISSDIIGTWKLIEVLADPGDGSGEFYGVNSNKLITFHADNTLSSNGTICNMSIEANGSSKGTYSLIDSTISSANCSAMEITFEIQGRYLIISYPCIEPCQAKFLRK